MRMKRDMDLIRLQLLGVEGEQPVFGTFDYSSYAVAEVSRLFKQNGRVIIPLIVHEILPKEIAR